MNKVQLIGRLTRDPEIRALTTGTQVATFTLAVDRRFGKETDFIYIKAWAKQAEFAEKYLAKGVQIALAGRLEVRQYEDKDGAKRTATEVIAEEFYFTGTKQEAKTEDFEKTDNQEELPF